MAIYVGRDEGAEGDDLPAGGPHVIEGVASQGGADTLPFVGVIDLGVHEDVTVTAEVVDGVANRLPFDRHDIAVVLFVVVDLEVERGLGRTGVGDVLAPTVP